MTYLFLHPIMHLLLFLSPDWLTFCHLIISHINSLGSLFIFCFSLTKGQCSKRQTILSVLAVHRPFYFDLYLYFAMYVLIYFERNRCYTIIYILCIVRYSQRTRGTLHCIPTEIWLLLNFNLQTCIHAHSRADSQFFSTFFLGVRCFCSKLIVDMQFHLL